MLSFPDGHFYFGSTGDKFSCNRKAGHMIDFRKGRHYKKVQEQYDKQGYPEFIKLGRGNKYDIKCKEHFYIKDNINDSKCLNTNIPWPPHIIKISIEKGNREAAKIMQKNYNWKEYNKTPIAKLNGKISSARQNIRRYSKLERWDKVDKWNIRLAERLLEKEKYKTSLVS